MERQEMMIQANKQKNDEKVEKAIACIKILLKENKQVTVKKLMEQTGLSRSFFYQNQKVHEELERAQGLQEGKKFVTPQRVGIDKAMSREINLLKKSIKEKDDRIKELESEVVVLKKKAAAKTEMLFKKL